MSARFPFLLFQLFFPSSLALAMTAVATPTAKDGLRGYYRAKIEEFELAVRDKTSNLRRLEAQRNELNHKGTYVPTPEMTLGRNGSLRSGHHRRSHHGDSPRSHQTRHTRTWHLIVPWGDALPRKSGTRVAPITHTTRLQHRSHNERAHRTSRFILYF